MRFKYITIKQAVLAVVRIFGPITARVAARQARKLITARELNVAVVKSHLEKMEAADLVAHGPDGWIGLPSALTIVEAA